MSDVPPPEGQNPQQPPQQPQQPPQQPAGQQPPPQQPAGQQPPPQQPAGQQPPPQQQPPPPAGQPQPAPQAASGIGQPADLTNRFLAKLIDWVLLGVVLGIVWATMTAIFVGGAITGGFVGGGFLYGLISTIISTVIVLGYFAFLESNRGQTVGKMVLKLKVQRSDGSNPSMEEALKRNAYLGLYLLGIIPWVGWLLSSLGLLAATIYIAVTINNNAQTRQGWHDEFGGTQVIKVG